MVDAPFNAQFVGVRGDEITVMMPKQVMSRDEAIAHAAWLAVCADPGGAEFAAALAAVRNS